MIRKESIIFISDSKFTNSNTKNNIINKRICGAGLNSFKLKISTFEDDSFWSVSK